MVEKGKMWGFAFPVGCIFCEPNNPYQINILEQQGHSISLVLKQENSS